ncbi:MAG: aromatic amino acid lyase [Polyangiaceae bacterium]|nr:aromatic amino acid lyase [Polyangiaceae bacterium]
MNARIKRVSHERGASASGVVEIGSKPVTFADLARVALDGAAVRLRDEELDGPLARSQTVLRAAFERGSPVYGSSTGYGSSCGNRIPAEEAQALGENLIRYHGCGVGEPLPVEVVRCAMLARLLCFRLGYSGVSRGLCGQLVAFLNQGITPVVPAMGSVGASGDLTPMSYVAAALAGEREVTFRDRRMPAAVALREAGLEPLRYQPKEPLAMINGTAVMTGVAVLSVVRARRLLSAATAATALAVHALAGHAHHFSPLIFTAKPFPGMVTTAAHLRKLLEARGEVEEATNQEALQDPYSLRCAPHVLGVLADALDWVERWVETEANSADDNPLLDPETGAVLTGGNFYGGHIAFAMDALKSAVASVGDLCDRQLALLVDPRFSRGLPEGLAAPGPQARGLHHGFKGMQITASALVAEALHATMPVASFSRSTESHNQDKVSMGTIAARSALRTIELVEGVVAVHLLGVAQGAELRGRLGARPGLQAVVQRLRELSPAVTEDRVLDEDLRRVQGAIGAGAFQDVALGT